MKSAVRAIIVHDNNILLMKRNKFGSEYYTLVGGHVELGENLLDALHREIYEETCLKVKNPRQVFIEDAPQPYGKQHIFLCTYIEGELQLHPESDEIKINALGKNIYTPMWVPISKLASLPFRSKNLQQKLLQALENEFPKEIVRFSTKES